MSLLAPFPYFGGKRTIAADIWARLGTPKQYVEPFCGSAAVLGRGLLTERDRFDLLLPVLARSVIDAVLARRQREAARTGPWDAP